MLFEPEVREDHGMIDVNGDLLGAALCCDVLGTREWRTTTVARKSDQIFCDQRHRAARTLLPRRVSRRVDDDLTDNSPTRVMRIAAGNEEPRERLRHPQCVRLGPVAVQVSQCRRHAPAVLDRSGDLARAQTRLA